jgi:hypothetical protein
MAEHLASTKTYSYHMCSSIRGALRRSHTEMRRALLYTFKDDGSPYRSVAELREALFDELAKGHEVIPMGDCDNFDWKTGCQGHEEPTADGSTAGCAALGIEVPGA